jgi:hypothetical protein
MTRPEFIPAGRSAELLARPDAHLLLTKPRGWDLKVIKFKSRRALEEFNKKAGLRAVVKNKVAKGCAIYGHEEEA